MTSEHQKRFSIQEDKPSNWFEPLYRGSDTTGEGVPWANMATHPSFANWLAENPQKGDGKSALVVGCGMGDDAIELESLGFQVTAFDVSETAIKFCRERFPQSKVDFRQADLLQDQPQWQQKFDFVLEIFTVQALPPKYEREIIRNISGFVVADGQMLVIAEVSEEERSFENGPPWLLTPQHIDSFSSSGLRVAGQYVEKGSLRNDDSNVYVTTFIRPGR
ncbi:MAG: class I SAM-dependent methyltransferase [Gammaproteobacteria bacterium]